MRPVTEDRRTRKTRAALENAFAELIQKKDIKKITIKDITDMADTNRSTFYTHYEDIYDLLRVLEDRLINGISALSAEAIISGQGEIPAPHTTNITNILQYVLDNKALFKSIVRSSQGQEFISRVTDIIGEKLMTLMALIGEAPDNGMIACFFTNGAVAAIRQWLENDEYSDISAEQMCLFIENIIKTGIHALSENK